MALTATHQKEIRAVACDLAREGKARSQIQQAVEDLAAVYAVLDELVPGGGRKLPGRQIVGGVAAAQPAVAAK